MLKISTIDTPIQRTLVVEGKLISPWTTELRIAFDNAKRDAKGRELFVDLKNLTMIGQEGEDLLVELMNEGAKFRCCGVFTRQVMRQVARGRAHRGHRATQ